MNEDSGATYPGTPRWVKISAIAVVALIVLAAVAMVVVGGEHGPSRHLPGGAAVGKTAGH